MDYARVDDASAETSQHERLETNEFHHPLPNVMKIGVLDKVGRILDCVAAGEVGVRELAEMTGEPRGSLYRLVGDLQELGIVEPGLKPGRYRLGVRLFHLGSLVSERFHDERAAALAAMERLHETAGQTVFLCVRRDYGALCIERIDGVLVQEMLLRVGATMPLHVGAIGRVLFAHEPPEFFDDYVAHVELKAYVDATTITKKRLADALDHIRKAGYAVADGDVIPGIAGIAAPVFDFDRGCRAVVAMSGPRPAILGENTDATRTSVLAAARDISTALGAPPFENGTKREQPGQER